MVLPPISLGSADPAFTGVINWESARSPIFQIANLPQIPWNAPPTHQGNPTKPPVNHQKYINFSEQKFGAPKGVVTLLQ
ncbi:MAG: hypothetical protein ACJARR_001769 [Pseudophaeobacter arcticus]|jgi:hypothetical protein